MATPAETARISAWLDDDLAHVLDSPSVATVRRALEVGATDLVSANAEGGWTCWRRLSDGRRARLLDLDPSGHVVTLVRWHDDGPLGEAWVRVPPAGFVGIEAASAMRQPSTRDALRFADAPRDASTRTLGTFAALDYACLVEIPVLPEPAALPPHAGTAVLNLLACLARDTAGGPLHYRGPYPSEALFLALLEAFRYAPPADDPLEAFVQGRLAWWPAPHTRWFTAQDAFVQRRGRVEKVVWHGRTYYRADWQGVARHAPRRIHDDGAATRCSLWALGHPLACHLCLAPSGEIVDVSPPTPATPTVVRSVSPVVIRGIENVVIAQSAPALGPTLRDVLASLAFEWGPVNDDLVDTTENGVRVATIFLDALVSGMNAAATREARLALGLIALTELGALVGDDLRRRAQARLLALSEAEQARALTATDPAAPSAAAIAAAVEALVTEATADGAVGGDVSAGF